MLHSSFLLTFIFYTDDSSPIFSLSGCFNFHHIDHFLFRNLNFKQIFPMPPVATIAVS